MTGIKKLFGDAALYGMSSVLARLLNFLLTPLLTVYLTKSEYGINALLYVSVAFLMVILTYGFETAYFRMVGKSENDSRSVFSTAMWSVLSTTGLFLLLAHLFYGSASAVFSLADRPWFVLMMAWIVAMDVIATIPFARIRSQSRAARFVWIKTAQILFNLLLNFLFFMVLPSFYADWPSLGVGWVLIANLGASLLMLLLLVPEFRAIRWEFDVIIWKRMLWFGFPLLLAGLPGIANEMADRFFLDALLPPSLALEGVATYAAIYKLSVFLILFNQAFRFAAEPYFFGQAETGGEGGRKQLALAARLFAGMLCIGFVFVLAALPWLKHFVASKYWADLGLLPVLLFANVLLSLNTQVSMWYKLSDKTRFGLYITLLGFVVTVVGNMHWIPLIGIMGAAYATLASYSVMLLMSVLMGQRHYPVPYDFLRIGGYVVVSVLLAWTAFHFDATFIKVGALIAMVGIVVGSEWKLLSGQNVIRD